MSNLLSSELSTNSSEHLTGLVELGGNVGGVAGRKIGCSEKILLSKKSEALWVYRSERVMVGRWIEA